MFRKIVKTFFITLVFYTSVQAKEININQFVKSAKKSSKHLFVWLHKTDCGYCESMKEFTLHNEIIKSFINEHFIFLHINVKEDDKIIYNKFNGSAYEFAKEIGYDFYPSSIFFDNNAKIIFTEIGYRDSESLSNEKRFFTILNFINSKSYKRINYEDYKFTIKKEF